MDDDWGPTYNVRMRRGQGYNSYIEEPRIDNAVLITEKADAGTSTSVAQAGDGVSTSSATATLTEAATGKPQTSDRLTMDDFFSTLLERMGKGSEELKKSKDEKTLPYLLRPSGSAALNQTVLFSSNEIKSKEDIDKAIGINASAKIKAGSIGPGAEAGNNLATSDDVNTNDLNFLIHVKVVNESVDKSEDWSFNPVTNLAMRLKAAGEDPHKKAVEFTRIYGDTFISDFVEGGELYAWVGIKSQDKRHIGHLRTYASAQLTPPTVPVQVETSLELTNEKKEAYSQAQTSIRVQWRGGGEIKTHDFRWGMDSLVQIANAFPSFVAVTPARIRAILTPYTSLKSFQDVQTTYSNEPLTLSYDQCQLYTSTLYEDFVSFQKICNEINEMIENPSEYRSRKPKKAQKDRWETPPSPSTAIAPRIKVPQMPHKTQTDPWEPAYGPSHTIPGPSKTRWPNVQELKQARPNTGRKYALVDVDTILADRQFPEMEPMEPDPQKLSTMRLICRSAMIYIQEQAAALVIDPTRCLTIFDNENPLYVSQRYPCPGTLANLLPVAIRGKDDWEDAIRFKAVNDLKLTGDIVYPKYYWEAFGDRLSQYKSYEHFQLGDFDDDSQQYPQAIAIQTHTSRVRRYFDKASRDANNAIAGLAFKYRWRPKSLSEKTRINILADGKTGSGLMTTLSGGKKPINDSSWQEVKDVLKRTPPINRIRVYFKPGSGMIFGLEFLCEADPEGQEVSPGIVASHKNFDMQNGDRDDGSDPMDGMEITTSYPGDSDDIDAEKNWMFAGLVGAFEKVGPFKRDRVLARIAVIWRRKIADDDGGIPSALASDKRRSKSYSVA